ncbi:MAG: redox-regulated ATPase YchF [Candidatus Hydrogenedentes bacterium]|nr:redox-regulated ATPase YchF [Candidatus Hydrogenedentota bacterium]
MALSIGIVGLPNVGKSTTFNALTKAQNAEAANYPFCTIEPNKAIVPVPDKRLDKLAELVKPQRILFSTIEFVDIAGLVKGASTGEGLGNQFLGNIRETSAIVHVVRCFDDENVIHVNAKTDPADDIEVINTELIMADLQQLEKRIDRLRKQAKGDKKIQPQIDIAEALIAHLNSGQPASLFPDRESDAFIALDKEMQFITTKAVIFAANVDEAGLGEDNDHVKAVRAYAEKHGAEVVKLCAKIEEEMTGMSDEERHEFLADLGATESGLDQVIRKGFHALGLISYFTAGEKEVRAWTIHTGWTAPQAAGVIHSDFERGFIRAEVIPYEVYVKHGSEQACKAAGQMSVEGKDYIVQDGDVMHFRFNV